MKSLKQDLGRTFYSFAGQISFLLSNFILFLYLAKRYDQASFGHWAIFITTVSILDGLRQGFTQNGLARLIIRQPDNREIKSTSLLLNYAIVALTSLFLVVFSLWSAPELSILYINGFKALLVLATIQFLNSVNQAQQKFKKYFITNFIYLISFIAVLSAQLIVAGQPSLTRLIDIMFLSVLPVTILAIVQGEFRLVRPLKSTAMELIHFGKYSSGTNLLSLLFQRVDLLMINYFMDPTAVAIFHFANKIIGYAELPLQAISQVIYPKIAASYLQSGGIHLKKTYGNSILWLLAFILPTTLIVLLFNKTIITIIGSESYLSASGIIIILATATLFKPWGRVFGLTLDAVGKPRVNFLMLVFSLAVNVVMNWLLIPAFGVQGAATATASSVIVTIIIGQLNIKRTLAIHPIKEFVVAAKSLTHLNALKKWS
jgi:O-antigen/teichoic acid export membrane protein